MCKKKFLSSFLERCGKQKNFFTYQIYLEALGNKGIYKKEKKKTLKKTRERKTDLNFHIQIVH